MVSMLAAIAMPLTATDVATDANETNAGIVVSEYSYDISIVICLPLYRDRMKQQLSLCSGAIKTWVCKYQFLYTCWLVLMCFVYTVSCALLD